MRAPPRAGLFLVQAPTNRTPGLVHDLRAFERRITEMLPDEVIAVRGEPVIVNALRIALISFTVAQPLVALNLVKRELLSPMRLGILTRPGGNGLTRSIGDLPQAFGEMIRISCDYAAKDKEQPIGEFYIMFLDGREPHLLAGLDGAYC